MRKKSYLTFTDQFCGAGGSSQGVRNVARKKGGGIEVKLALNHWKLAIETHNTNFPETLHDCTDVSACDPRRYPSTDFLITSPECTNHSLAKGIKSVKAQLDLFVKGIVDPSAERSRATMWDVPRFAEYHNYRFVIVENVVDARKWVMFDAWIHAMHSLGYNHKCVYLNSMHCHPTPQSRDRMYVVFWKKNQRTPNLEFNPSAFCEKCAKNVNSVQSWKNGASFGKYRFQYVYRCPECTSVVEPFYYAAFNIIDWSDIGERIGDRKKDLSPNTKKRIQYGLEKYSNENFFFHAAYGSEARGVVRPVSREMFTQTTFKSVAFLNPFVINSQHTTGIECRVKGMNETINLITSTPNFRLVTPPFIIKGEHTLQPGYTKSIAEHVQTQTVRQSMALVTPPLLIEMNRTGKAKPATQHPTSTVTAGGINHSIVTTDAWNTFITAYYNGSHCTNHLTDVIGTQATKERHNLITYSGKKPRIEDCFYRMIKAHEVKRAMAFDEEYIVLGNSKNQVKQLGNAVTPPAMEMLVERCVESLM